MNRCASPIRAKALPLLVLSLAASSCGKEAGAGPCELFETQGECDLAASFALPAELPPAVDNPQAEQEAAALLGFEIFYDARFSADQNTRCATCHAPERHFQDADTSPEGFEVYRNTPTVRSAPWMRAWTWDGSADSLWSQPLIALEAAAEMDFGRVEIARRVEKSYAARYAEAFAPLPDLTAFPETGRPGSASWDALSPLEQSTINDIAANVGRALEAYMRKIPTSQGRFDDYLAGDSGALTALEKRGFQVFIDAGCSNCHSGPTFSDNRYYNIGVPEPVGVSPDPGRSAGVQRLTGSDFARADDPGPRIDGAFRTPSLRDLSETAPYGHSGIFATVEDVVRFHLEGGGQAGGNFIGTVTEQLVPVQLSVDDVAALVAFLGSLDGAEAPLPWGDWPDR